MSESHQIKPNFNNFYTSQLSMLVKFWYLLHPGIDYGATRIFVDKREVRLFFMSSWRTFWGQFPNPLKLEAGDFGSQLNINNCLLTCLTGFCAYLRHERSGSLQRSQEWVLQVYAETVEVILNETQIFKYLCWKTFYETRRFWILMLLIREAHGLLLVGDVTHRSGPYLIFVTGATGSARVNFFWPV